MGSLSKRDDRRIRAVKAVCLVALLTASAFASLGTQSQIAHAAPKAACSDNWLANGDYGYWDAQYDVEGLASCNTSPPEAEGWLRPCSGVYVTANMDTWLTQTWPGGVRLAESGRTGNLTWYPDCAWHRQVRVWGWGQVFVTPLWACLWVYDSTVNLSFAYLCTPAY
jgi:hypothetical protein